MREAAEKEGDSWAITGFGVALNQVMALEPSSPAVEYGVRWYSWSDLRKAVSGVQLALDAAGVGPEHRTGVLIRNRLPLLAAMLGEEGVLELKTAQIHGGQEWYRTTDRAIIDEDNFLTICGRTDAAIIRGGFKIHPDEVVRAIEQHPAVREASVVGLPDERLGALPVAAVIVREGMSLSVGDLTAFVKASLSPYQVPAHFVYFKDFPRTPSMKPALPELRQKLVEALKTGVATEGTSQ